jgi:hypothetical protein
MEVMEAVDATMTKEEKKDQGAIEVCRLSRYIVMRYA